MRGSGCDSAAGDSELLQAQLTGQHVIEVLPQQLVLGGGSRRLEHSTYTSFG